MDAAIGVQEAASCCAGRLGSHRHRTRVGCGSDFGRSRDSRLTASITALRCDRVPDDPRRFAIITTTFPRIPICLRVSLTHLATVPG